MKLFTSKGFVSIGACLFFAAIMYFAAQFAESRNGGKDDATRLMKLMNFIPLPAGYHRLEGEDSTNYRALWVEHDGASENARVLVFLVEDGDASSSKLNDYASNHMGLSCKREITYPKNINKKFIKVTKALCRSEDGTSVLDQQALFHMYKGYSAVVYESSETSEFDHAAFNMVVDTVANANPSKVKL
jgi:hypothetical protein